MTREGVFRCRELLRSIRRLRVAEARYRLTRKSGARQCGNTGRTPDHEHPASRCHMAIRDSSRRARQSGRPGSHRAPLPPKKRTGAGQPAVPPKPIALRPPPRESAPRQALIRRIETALAVTSMVTCTLNDQAEGRDCDAALALQRCVREPLLEIIDDLERLSFRGART